jgi:hypothetical protein
LHGLWPSAASALTCLKQRLPRLPAYLEHARAIAAALGAAPGVTVVPDPPQVPMMHLLLTVTKDDYAAAAARLADERGIWIGPGVFSTTANPAVQVVELSVGDATLGFTPGEVREIYASITAAV